MYRKYNRSNYYLKVTDKVAYKGEHNGLNAALSAIQDIYSRKYNVSDYGSVIGEKLREDSGIKNKNIPRIIKRKTKRFKKIRSSFDKNLGGAIICTEKIQKIDSTILMLRAISKLKYTDNKETEKVVNIASGLISKLSSYRVKLEKKTMKYLEEVDKRRRQLEGFEVGKVGKLNRDEWSFVLSVLQSAKDVLNVSKGNDLSEKIEKKNEEISENYDRKIEETKEEVSKIFEQISTIEMQLTDIKDSDLKESVENEITTIRRVVKPSIVTVSEENLKKLKESKTLEEDSKLFIEEVEQSPYIGMSNKRERMILRKLEELENRLRHLLEVSIDKGNELSLEQNEIQKDLNTSEKALDNYQTTITEQENKERIPEITSRNNAKIEEQITKLDSELSKLISLHGQTYELGHEVRYGEPRAIQGKYDYSDKIKELRDEINELRKKQEENEMYKDNVQRKNVQISDEYLNLKEKLQSQSSLRKSILKRKGKIL